MGVGKGAFITFWKVRTRFLARVFAKKYGINHQGQDEVSTPDFGEGTARRLQPWLGKVTNEAQRRRSQRNKKEG